MNPFFVPCPHKSKVCDATTEPLGLKAKVTFCMHHGVTRGRVATEKNSCLLAGICAQHVNPSQGMGGLRGTGKGPAGRMQCSRAA